jgi:tetratricopeptide (TPR) repeat protein
VAAFEVILANDPDSVGVLFNLGNLYIELGDVERGVALVNRAVELDPSLRGE